MAEMGCPILGDSKYSNQKDKRVAGEERSIALCATAISFKSATEDKTIKLEIPLPESWKHII